MNNSNASLSGSQSDDNDTVGQTLATGSQDIAALAGLFCTDGVERNALATEYGYTTIIGSCLSILGILGLVKSSVKLALGLQQCISSGYSPDTLRGIFGYTLNESTKTLKDTIECLRVSVHQDRDNIILEKERQLFDEDGAPMLAGGWHEILDEDDLPPYTIISLGNSVRVSELAQNGFIISMLTVLCSGLTSWVLLIVFWDQPHPWHWTTYLATIGLHISLIVMIAPALWHAHRTCRPSKYITSAIWDNLTRSQKHIDNFTSFTFMRTCRLLPKPKPGEPSGSTFEGFHQVLHFRGDVSYLHSFYFKVIMMATSALCAASYICQYTVLKGAESTQAAVWIGVQAGFALLRVLIWIGQPPFDDPKTQHAEYMLFETALFDEMSLMRILTDFMADGKQDFDNTDPTDTIRRIKIPKWAWEYMQQNDLGQIVEAAKRLHPSEFPPIPDESQPFRHKPSRMFYRTEDDRADFYMLDASLTSLFDRKRQTIEDLGQGDEPLKSVTDFKLVSRLNTRLLLVQTRRLQSRQVRPFIVLDGQYSLLNDTDKLFEPQRWRFGGNPNSTWMMLPAAHDVDYQLARHSTDSISKGASSAIRLLEQQYRGDTAHSFLELQPIMIPDPVSGNLPLLECLQRYYAFDFETLNGVTVALDSTFLLDLRHLPYPRSWVPYRIAEGNPNQTPSDWLSDCGGNFNARNASKKLHYQLTFKSIEQCMHFASNYIAHDSELHGIRGLKRVMKLKALLTRLISFMRSDLSGPEIDQRIKHFPPLQKIRSTYEQRIEAASEQLQSLPFETIVIIRN